MLVWILIGAGLVLVVEGLLYALAPSLARQMAEAAARVPPGALRVAGLAAVAAGVLLVALARALG
ncbi:MAG: hypothetical protein HLUCCA04_00665 [Oceanicaulis sp. HLUCCA04]|nr:MAG: hypothetical protein HLUCCA04_00665 [Oceanicaulis sp. HLUCCA04]